MKLSYLSLSFYFISLTISPNMVFSQDSNKESQNYIFKTAIGHWKSQSLYIVAKLSIADLLKEKVMSVETIAQELNVRVDPLYRIMRTLAIEDVFKESANRKFGLGKKGHCLRSDVSCSMKNAVLMYGAEQYKAWSNIDSVFKLTNSQSNPFEQTFGQSVFDYFKNNPESGRIFNVAMKELAQEIYSQSSIIKAYDFSNFKKIIDIGGGNGHFLNEILSTLSPTVQGSLFDLPKVIQAYQGQNKNISLVAGDFFESVPDGGDLYILKRVLHDWSDDQAILILSKIRKAMNPQSKLIIVEFVIDQKQKLPHWLDLHMMVMTGGRERSDGEFKNILEKSGFKINKIIPTQGKLSIIDAVAG